MSHPHRAIACVVLLLTVSLPAAAQVPVQCPCLAGTPPPPAREVGVTWSAWASGNDTRSLGLSYGRYLTKDTSLEVALDVGRGDRSVFTLSSVQLRAAPRDARSPLSLVLGVAHATADLPAAGDPRGLALLLGGGAYIRPSTRVAVRTDLQLLKFRDHAVAGRLVVTALFGLD
jgi:hypothetical protein